MFHGVTFLGGCVYSERCESGTKKDGVRICALHEQPLIGRVEAERRGLTVFMDAEWFCPVTGAAFGSFGVVDGLIGEIAEG